MSKIVNLADLKVEKATSTSTDTASHSATSTSTAGTDYKRTPAGGNGGGNKAPANHSGFYEPPDNDWKVWAAIAFLGAWLAAITYIGFNQVIDIREKAHNNHQEITNTVHKLETKISDQINAFERRLNIKLDDDKKDISRDIEKQEAELNELQKMLYNSKNQINKE